MSNMTYSNQLVLLSQNSDERNTNCQLRIRTNIYSPTPITIFVAEDDESLPHTFTKSMDTIKFAFWCRNKLLAGYLSALCAVLPDLTKLAHEILKNLGFKVMEEMVSSRSAYFNCMTQVLSFAQLIYIPFTNNFKGIGKFWNTVARNARIERPIYLLQESDVKFLHSALMASGLIAQMCGEVYRAQQVFAAMSPPFGLIFTEASKCAYVEDRDKLRFWCKKTYVVSA